MYGRIFKPFTVGEFLILPEGETGCAEGKLPLIMGKKGAFGSGEHETTASCLEEMARLPLDGMQCLDLGSGTGILAIAAIRLGAASAVAVDIEPAAALSCARNVRLNQVEDRVFPVCGELSAIRNRTFDLFLANIYAEIHLALAGEMVAMTKPGGLLLLSGIPTQDNFDILRQFQRRDCQLMNSRYMDEFVTFLFRRES